MTLYSLSCLAVSGILLLAYSAPIVAAEVQDYQEQMPGTVRLAAAQSNEVKDVPEAGAKLSGAEIRSAVVHPFQASNVPSEVSGIVSGFTHRVGDRVRKGDVVATISSKRYALAVKSAEQRLRADELSLKYAEERVKATEALLSLDWTTTQKLMEARERAALCRARLNESRQLLEAVHLDLDACAVKAPFDGILAVRYKEPFEAIERLEKLFLLIDTAKVYAVASVPEDLLKTFRKGIRASFTQGSGEKAKGTVDRVGTLINPESRTGRVWILIDNPQGIFEVGMTGVLRIE